jgi:hypothetical protein
VISLVGGMLSTSESHFEHWHVAKEGSKKIPAASGVAGQNAMLVPSMNSYQSASRGGFPTKCSMLSGRGGLPFCRSMNPES